MKSYNDYNSYLRNRFGCKVYRIGLDAGFTCPVRDGTKGTGGCLYCNERGSRASYSDPSLSVYGQLKKRMEYLKANKKAEKFIAYFQAFSNTYASPSRLKAVYDGIIPFEEIVGISISTRPDTIDGEKLEIIASYKKRYDVWMEYGLQTIHDRTLNFLNRGHTYKDFIKSVELTRRFSIPICAHVILGLPGETRDDMMATAHELKKLKIEGVKIHLLHVLKGSVLESFYNEGKVKLLSQDEYVKLAADFLEELPKETIIYRVTGEGMRGEHIAPRWAMDKLGTIEKIRSSYCRV